MATIKQRVCKYNGSGYDVLHLETASSIVLRSNGTTLEAALPEVQSDDAPPDELDDGKILVGLTKAWIGFGGKPKEVTLRNNS